MSAESLIPAHPAPPALALHHPLALGRTDLYLGSLRFAPSWLPAKKEPDRWPRFIVVNPAGNTLSTFTYSPP